MNKFRLRISRPNQRSIDPWPEDVKLEDVVVNEYLTLKEYCTGCVPVGRSFKDAATDMVGKNTIVTIIGFSPTVGDFVQPNNHSAAVKWGDLWTWKILFDKTDM